MSNFNVILAIGAIAILVALYIGFKPTNNKQALNEQAWRGGMATPAHPNGIKVYNGSSPWEICRDTDPFVDGPFYTLGIGVCKLTVGP